MTIRTAAGLDRSLVLGIAWTSSSKWGSSLITLGLTVVTARILTPSDYGLMGIAIVCIGFAQLVSDVGLHATIIRAPELSEDLAARLGGAALMLSIAVAATMVGIAPLLAEFFREPRVRWIITALSASFVLRGLQVLRRAMLARALQFKPLALIEAGEAIVSAVTALSFAAAGAGYWSLVIGLVAGASVSTVACILLFPHRLEFPQRLSQLGDTLSFGSQVLGGQLAWYAYTSADVVIVGRMLGSAALGAYTFAWVLAGLAVERVAGLAARVTPAIFSAVQRDHAALRRYVYALTEGLALITMPICIGLALTADLIVPVVLGPAWAAVVEPMRILAVYASIRCVALLFSQVLVYTGKARRSMQYNLLALFVLVPLFVLGASLGQASGVAWVWLLAFPVLTMATYFRELRRTIGLSVDAYFDSVKPALTATAVMTVVVISLRLAWTAPGREALELATTIVAAASAYGLVVYVRYLHRFQRLLGLLRGQEATLSASSGDATVLSAAPGGRSAPRGRLLLICFHYPPDPAIGSLRWQKFTRHAAALGWGVDVVMRDETRIAVPDLERLADLPHDVRRYGIVEQPFWFEGLERRAANFYRRFVPRRVAAESMRAQDVRQVRSGRDVARAYFAFVAHLRTRRWAAAAATRASDIYIEGTHRAIIACGPPFSACIAGRLLARRLGLPLILDFRDPWSAPQRMPESVASPVALALSRREEALAVHASALVVANSSPVGDAMRARYPRSRILDVPNGFDDDPLPQGAPRDRFLIAYAGTIYLDRDPTTLFAALRRVVMSEGLTPDDIGIEFMGSVERIDGRSLEDRARAAGVEAFVTVRPTRPRSEALEFLAGASMLVLLAQDADMVIPGKLYEYMRFEAWLLVLAEPSHASARLLAGSSADIVSDADGAAIADVIARRFAEFRAGRRAVPLAVDQRYSRAARAEAFFGALDQLLGVRELAPRSEPTLHPPLVTAR